MPEPIPVTASQEITRPPERISSRPLTQEVPPKVITKGRRLFRLRLHTPSRDVARGHNLSVENAQDHVAMGRICAPLGAHRI